MTETFVPPTWRERLESLVGRRREWWAVAGLVAAVAMVALGLWSRGAPPRVAPPRTYEPGTGWAPEAGPSPARPGAAAQAILVHVAGAVRRPGLYRISAGSRVADAIQAAGGVRRRADLDLLNLAEPLTDGQKVEVLTAAAAVPPTTGAPTTASVPSPGAPTPGSLVNINTADQAALESIPEVGPVTAAAIIEYREQIGSFDSVEQLLDVSGIGPATLEAVRPYVTV